MRYRAAPPRRAGFTLIELLVVIAILALLTALTVGAINSVRTAQTNRASDQMVTNLQKGVDQTLKAVLDEATSDKNPDLAKVLSFCDGDKDRAKSLLAYLYVKREFPATFAEATTAVTIPGVITLLPHKAFTSVATGGGATDESAVLLYLLLTEKGNRGVLTGAEGTLTTTDGNYTVFRDANYRPVRFQRWYEATELDNPPYANPKAIKGVTITDPYDRQSQFDGKGKLTHWTNATNRPLALTALGLSNFDGRNKVVTVVADGEDKTPNTFDDRYGYRLGQIGNSGN